MNATFVIWLLVAGLGVGFINGMFGVGGCFLMVPTMFFLFKGLGVPVDTAMKISLGTNMAVVVPTALSGVLRHARIKKFSLPHYWNFAIPVGIGSLVGSGIAVFVPGAILKVLFGVLCLIGAYRFMTAKPRPVDEMPPVERGKFWPTGFGGGFIAHFLGIGGGLVYVHSPGPPPPIGHSATSQLRLFQPGGLAGIGGDQHPAGPGRRHRGPQAER